MKKVIVVAVFGMLTSVAAQAAPVMYSGALIPNVAASGTASGFSWFLDGGAGVNLWSFSGLAGQIVTLEVDRLNPNFDPGLSLFQGVTTADTSAYTSSGNWGGLTFIGSLDDEHSPFIGGSSAPGGDPYGSFKLTATGSYTVAVGGSLSTDAGLYPYKLIMTVSAVPEPSTYLMLGMGIGALAWLRRKETCDSV